ncbi:MAG TPA: DHA2 family efflux MFS transporter permease subunit [Phenylobacterium sp.]
MASAQDVRNRIPITGALMLATLMYTLDSTIANVALPHMQGSLSASQDQITWVLTSYILATAVMTPLAGWLAQKIGRKRMLLYSIVGFTVASMLCGVAQNVTEMVAFRVLQGLAGASLMPLSQSVMLDIFPMSMIPRVMSIWSAAVIMGPIFGPILGGSITEHLDWRWVFYINLPVGILATLGVFNFMARDPGGRERPFDFIGFGSLIAFIVGLQVMLDRGPGRDWFDSKEIWVEAAIGLAGLWVFIVQTATAEHPFYHRDLAKDGNFIGTTIFGFFVGVLLFSTTALLPSFMQNLLGYSALQSGEASVTRGIGSLISFLLVPFVMARLGARTALTSGLVLSIGALWMMGQFNLAMTSSPILVSGFIQGFGTGLLFAPLSTLGYATLDQSHRVEGTIVSTMARSLGSSVGISVIQAMVLRDSASAHSELAGRMDPSNPVINSILPKLMDTGTTSGLSILNGEITRQSAMLGYVNIFSWMALVTCILFPLILILRPAPKAPVDMTESLSE